MSQNETKHEVQGNIQIKIFVTVLTVVLGFVALVIPAYFIGTGIHTTYSSPVSSVLRTAFENLNLFGSLISFFILGMGVGYLEIIPAWLIGAASVSMSLLIVFLEVIIAPSSHNLLPIEIMVYTLFYMATIIGASLSSKLLNR